VPAAEGEPRWVGGELGGFYFVQRISEDPGERTNLEIAEAWAAKLTGAIRQHDRETPITVGVIPWAHVWPNAKPLFYSPQVARHFDFASIHLYPGKDKVAEAITGVLSNVVDGVSQAAGFSCLMPSTKTVPLMTSGRSVEPFNARHFFDADPISL
jgi:hypothetical protein